MPFNNSPRNTNFNSEQRIRWVHQPLAIDHYGIHATISKDGKVKIEKIADTQSAESKDAGEVDYDEIEVPASLIFKLASALKMTRTAESVSSAISETREVEEQG